MHSPQLTVVVPARDAAATLTEALFSVTQQSYGDLECLVVDDGSSDGTREIANSFSRRDGRFRTLSTRGFGVSAARNLALGLARGKYIAFLDADDLSHPHRFATQIRFLEENADIALVGSHAEIFGDGIPASARFQFLLEHDEILPGLLFTLEFLLSAVMMRRQVLDVVEGFDPRYRLAEDWEFLARVARHFKCANLPQPLVRYRVHPAQTTHGQVDTPGGPSMRVRLVHLAWLGIPPEEVDVEAHIALSPSHWPVVRDVPAEAFAPDRLACWAERMVAANEKSDRFNHAVFLRLLEKALRGEHAPAF